MTKLRGKQGGMLLVEVLVGNAVEVPPASPVFAEAKNASMIRSSNWRFAAATEFCT